MLVVTETAQRGYRLAKPVLGKEASRKARGRVEQLGGRFHKVDGRRRLVIAQVVCCCCSDDPSSENHSGRHPAERDRITKSILEYRLSFQGGRLLSCEPW